MLHEGLPGQPSPPRESMMQTLTVPRHVRLMTAAAALLTLIVTALFPLTAQAATTSASACLQGFSGPTAVVNSYGGITMKCGDLTKGVIHIDQSHPIRENGADDVNVEECMNNIIAYGSYVSASTGNTAKRWRTASGVYAYIVWRSSQKDVVTMYTSGSVSNRWDLCD